MSPQILNKNGFFRGFIPEMYNHIDNYLVHVTVFKEEYYFRAYGRTICLIEDEEHLLKLVDENKNITDSFNNYPIKTYNNEHSKN